MRRSSLSLWLERAPWLLVGALVGISFFAQPVKFLTPGLSNAQLVTVGATIFNASHTMQWVALGGITLFALQAKRSRGVAALWLAAAAAVLAAQQTWLMPALNARLLLLNQGGNPPSSVHHIAYVVLELLKLTALVAFAQLRPRTSQFGDVQ